MCHYCFLAVPNRRIQLAEWFPNEASLLRLVSAILMEPGEEWETGKRYLNMDVESDLDARTNRLQKKRCALSFSCPKLLIVGLARIFHRRGR